MSYQTVILVEGVRGLLGIRPEWTERAACRDADPEMFFPEKGESSAAAVRICRRCPVKEECLTAALARREKHGVWGGLSERAFRNRMAELPRLPRVTRASLRAARRRVA